MGKYTLTVRRIGLSAVITPLVTLSNIILLPILTRNLVVSDYGAFALIMITLALLPPLVTLGLHNSLIRFGAAAKDKRHPRVVLLHGTSRFRCERDCFWAASFVCAANSGELVSKQSHHSSAACTERLNCVPDFFCLAVFCNVPANQKVHLLKPF